MAVLEKKALSFDELEAQTALELPDREPPALVTIACVLGCIGEFTIEVPVAANVCVNAQVTAALGVLSNALTRATGEETRLECQADAQP